MIYLDTSALAKLVVAERESAELIHWLNDVTDDEFAEVARPGVHRPRTHCCTAEIGRIELMRTAQRLEPGPNSSTAEAARRILGKVDTLLMTREIVEMAQTLPPADLRTLDAIHLATILVNKPSVTMVCAYDRRLIAACEHHNLDVIAPGV